MIENEFKLCWQQIKLLLAFHLTAGLCTRLQGLASDYWAFSQILVFSSSTMVSTKSGIQCLTQMANAPLPSHWLCWSQDSRHTQYQVAVCDSQMLEEQLRQLEVDADALDAISRAQWLQQEASLHSTALPTSYSFNYPVSLMGPDTSDARHRMPREILHHVPRMSGFPDFRISEIRKSIGCRICTCRTLPKKLGYTSRVRFQRSVETPTAG